MGNCKDNSGTAEDKEIIEEEIAKTGETFSNFYEKVGNCLESLDIQEEALLTQDAINERQNLEIALLKEKIRVAKEQQIEFHPEGS